MNEENSMSVLEELLYACECGLNCVLYLADPDEARSQIDQIKKAITRGRKELGKEVEG